VNGTETQTGNNFNLPSNSSIATAHADNNPKIILKPTLENFVKIEICATKENPNGNIPFLKEFCGLLETIAHYLTPGNIMYDKENKHLTNFVLSHMTTLTQLKKHFSTMFRTANNKKPARHILVMKFNSAITLFEFKNQIFVEKYLTTTNMYMREHAIEYIMDTTSPGWLFGKHPQNHYKDDIKLEMLTDIGRACPNQRNPLFPPQFLLPNQKDDNGRLFCTHALCIHVDRNKNRILETLLKTTYKSNKLLFVAWSWKKDQPVGGSSSTI
jgi:hypothetical protein